MENKFIKSIINAAKDAGLNPKVIKVEIPKEEEKGEEKPKEEKKEHYLHFNFTEVKEGILTHAKGENINGKMYISALKTIIKHIKSETGSSIPEVMTLITSIVMNDLVEEVEDNGN